MKRGLIIIAVILAFFALGTGLWWLHDLRKVALERRAADERRRAAEQEQAEWLANQQVKMWQFKESVRKEAEARRDVQAASAAPEDLGRHPEVAARNDATRKRVEEIMSGHAKGFEGFNGTEGEAQLIADKERLRDLKNAIQRRGETREAPMPTTTPPIVEQTPSEAMAIVPTPAPQLPALFVTITKTAQKSPAGPRVPIPAGTKVQMISRGSNVVQVRYGGESVVVPIGSTDLK